MESGHSNIRSTPYDAYLWVRNLTQVIQIVTECYVLELEWIGPVVLKHSHHLFAHPLHLHSHNGNCILSTMETEPTIYSLLLYPLKPVTWQTPLHCSWHCWAEQLNKHKDQTLDFSTFDPRMERRRGLDSSQFLPSLPMYLPVIIEKFFEYVLLY